MWIVAGKELKNLLYSPKFIVMFIVSLLLIGLGTVNGYLHYRSDVSTALQMRSQNDDEIAKKTNLWEVKSGINIVRQPQRLAIFAVGVSGSIGRKSSISEWQNAALTDSRYEQDPVLALFGDLDLVFVLGTALSLFALLLSYNSISGEREAGTLQLLAANPVRRSSIILGKLIGGYLPLALIFLLPFLLSLIGLITLADISFSAGEWARIGLLALLGLLYLGVFHATGIAASALTRSSFVSFLACLLIWVLSVTVLPRLSIQAARWTNPSMDTGEMWDKYRAAIPDYDKTYYPMLKKIIESKNWTMDEYRKNSNQAFEEAQKEFQAVSREMNNKVQDEFRRRRGDMYHAAARYSLVSPTANLQQAAMLLMDTGPMLQESFETMGLTYMRNYTAWADDYFERHKNEDRANQSGWSYSMDKDGYISIVEMKGAVQEPPPLDLSGMPRFRQEMTPMTEILNDFFVHLFMLAIAAIIPFVIAWVAFLRYDVR